VAKLGAYLDLRKKVNFMNVFKKFNIISFFFGIFIILAFTNFSPEAEELTADSFQFPLLGDWKPSLDFEQKWEAYEGKHLGQDIVRSGGVEVYAIGNGIVKYSSDDTPGLGYGLIIEHKLPPGDPIGTHITSVYYHVKLKHDGKQPLNILKEGDFVKKGQIIRYISDIPGTYGSATHLHIGIRKGAFKKGCDPRTNVWFYPGYTTIFKQQSKDPLCRPTPSIIEHVKYDEKNPIHNEILKEWIKPSDFLQSRLSGTSTFPPTHTPPTSTCIASVSSNRWKGEYFNNKSLSGTPLMVRDDGTGYLNFNWGTGSPSSTCGIPSDNFSARWTRTFYFESGTYRFSVMADDGVRFYVDGSLKLDKWFDQPATTQNVDIPLSAGNHTLKMEYYESGGGAVAKLSWQKVETQQPNVPPLVDTQKLKEKVEEFAPILKKPPPPEVTRIEPSSGAPGITIKIYGNNLNPLMGPTVVFEAPYRGRTFGEVIPPLNNNELSVIVPSGSGSEEVHVETGGGSSSKYKFTYKEPHIDSVLPPFGKPGAEVIIKGKDFGFKRGISPSFSIKFGNSLAIVKSSSLWTDTQIAVQVPSDYGTGLNDANTVKKLLDLSRLGWSADEKKNKEIVSGLIKIFAPGLVNLELKEGDPWWKSFLKIMIALGVPGIKLIPDESMMEVAVEVKTPAGQSIGLFRYELPKPQTSLQSDLRPPNVTSFFASASQITQGQSVTLSYSVSDDVGISYVRLVRADDSAKIDFREIKRVSISGKQYTGSISDTPPSPGTYRYGVHVVDTKGQWNCERNSQTGFSPGVYGPRQVVVAGAPTVTPPIAPNISMSPPSGPVGTTFTQTGRGFTPNRTATLFGRNPDGSVVQIVTVNTDLSGSFTNTWIAQTPGNNLARWAVDNLTGQKSNEIVFNVTSAITTVDKPPNVTSFSASASQMNPGQSVALSYSVTDDVSLNRVELWRADDTAGVGFREIKRVSISGTSYSGSISDTPTSPGTYRYGLHVVDTAGKWNCERNSQTNFSPSQYGPKQVVVSSVQQTPVYNDLKEWLFKNQSVQITSNWNIKDCNYWSFLTDCRHTGIDFGAKEGAPVYSATDGVVINVALGSDCKEMNCLSTVAVWNESIGVTFLYLHMRDINVALNSPIKAGDPMGKVSQRGPATGPHLHFEARPGRHSLASLDVRQTIEPYEAARKARQIVSPIPSDTRPPTVTSFSASASQITQGQSVALSYSVSDDFGLKQVELWRADDTAGVGFREIKRVSISGKSYSGSFSDTPPSAGTYRYGVHVVDTAGKWNCERNSQTNFSPGQYGPKQVVVVGVPTVDNPPNVTSFSASSSQITQGQSLTLSFSVSDDVGLKQVELWRADDTAGVGFREIKRMTVSGKSYSGSISDTPPSAGTYRYGIHVVDTAGKWNCERNSQTNFSPGQYGPKQVVVVGAPTVDNLPNVTSFSASSSQITQGQSLTLSFSVSDDVGLKQVELWRADDSAGVGFREIKRVSISGKSNSSSISDTPPTAGTYRYGLHVVDTAGKWNCERNSQTNFSPGVYGPRQVVVGGAPTVDNPPNVTSFSASSSQINQGQSVTLSYSVVDDVGLKQVELWRADDTAGVGFREIRRVSVSGKQSSGTFSDTPSSPGTYRYGVHVVDTSGKWNCERNSQTNNSPGQYGPKQVVVGGAPTVDNPPNVTSFSASASQINQGQSVTLSYGVSDDVGLSRVELWRADDSAGVGFKEIKRVTVSGKQSSGTFSDTPSSPGTYRYGVHVVDTSGKWNCERNSQTGSSPGVYGPKQVVVIGAPTPALAPAPQIVSARVDSYSPGDPNNPVRIQVGGSATLNVRFTNTGNTAWRFIVGASVWDSAGRIVGDYSTTLSVTLQPGQQTSVSWSHPVRSVGEYWVQFGVWKQTPFIKDNLLEKKPSPAQRLIIGLK
jgi:murein DD-endopeptidase MepM/ murein hydrolase activator NlpD